MSEQDISDRDLRRSEYAIDRRQRRGRIFDFTVLAGCVAAVLFALFVLGHMNFFEVVTGMMAFCALASAYYIGSAPRAAAPRPPASVSPEPDAGHVSSRDLLEAFPSPTFELDREMRVTAYNAFADRVLRIGGRTAPRASTVIRSPALLSAIGDAQFEGAVEIESSDDEIWRAHVRHPGASGRTLVVLEDLRPVRSAARARADFLANASHELRTPLTAISGFIETLRGPARNDPASWDRFLGIMANETDRMKRLISDLLSLSRIETSEPAAPDTQVDLAVIVTEALTVLQPVAASREMLLHADVPSPLPVFASHDELVQVVENLVTNAFKYGAAGKAVRVSCGQSDTVAAAREAAMHAWADAARTTLIHPPARASDARFAVWLRVEDDGPGIEREHLPRLGERFYRADQSRGGQVTGTGLGLAIVKHIMAHHRGGLGVETRLGQGTAFGIWIPVSR